MSKFSGGRNSSFNSIKLNRITDVNDETSSINSYNNSQNESMSNYKMLMTDIKPK